METTVASAPTSSRDSLLKYLQAAFPSKDLPDIPEISSPNCFELSQPVSELVEKLKTDSPEETVSAMLHAVSTPDFRDFNDDLVNKANECLVTRVANAIFKIFKDQTEKDDVDERVSNLVGVQFSCLFPDERDERRNYERMEKCVLDSITSFKGSHVQLILKMMLRKCREIYVAVGLHKIVDLKQTEFLQKTFKSPSCLKELWSLLLSEVREIGNVDDSIPTQNFFQTTEFGSLLALSPLPDINVETVTLQKNDLVESLLKLYPDINLHDNRPTVSLDKNSVVPIVGDWLKLLLLSEDQTLRESVIDWVVSVLERNKIRCILGDPLSKKYEKACCDGYMLNFCQILLWIAQDLKLKENFSIRSYFDCLARLNHLEQKLFARDTEERVQEEKGWNLALTVLILCQRAISVCLLPAIERMQCFLQVCDGRKGKITDDPAAWEPMLALYDEVIWGRALCDLVRNFAETQLDILHSLLKAGAKDEKDLLPVEVFCNIASWYASYCASRRSAVEARTLDQFIEVCQLYLQFPNPNPKLAAHLVYALINLVGGNMTREIDQTLKPLLPVLVQCYVSMSTMFRNPSARGVYQIHLARCDFVVLFLGELNDENYLAMLQNCDFMEAVLETVVCLMASSISCDVSISQKKLARTEDEPSSAKEPQIYTPTEEEYLHAVEMHLILLDKLTSQCSSSHNFPSHRAACAFRWMLNNFYEKRKSCRSIRKKLIALSIKSFLNIFRGATDVQNSFKVALNQQDGLKVANLDRPQLKQELQASEKEDLKHLIEYVKTVSSTLDEFLNVSLDLEGDDRTALDEDLQLANFQNAFTDRQFGKADLLPTHSFRHILKDYSLTSAETKQHLEYQFAEFPIAFPHDLDSVKFLVRDRTREDVLQCMISGPAGTPYSRGLFVFDIYCPPEYPKEPPLVKFLNTGGGTALFNPRLQRDGNVCLSILGTSVNEDETGRWHGNGYSFLNILEEIFNLMRDDAKDESRVGEIRELTVRHALREPLRKAPRNFESIVQEYFSLSRKSLLQQLSRWGTHKDKYKDESRYTAIRHSIKIFVRKLCEIARNPTI